MKCTGLKEQCEWLEVGSTRSRVDKGKAKAKEVMTLQRGGEKQKKKKATTKVIIDDDDIMEVPGSSGSWSGFDPGPFLEQLDWLTGVVEKMTR